MKTIKPFTPDSVYLIHKDVGAVKGRRVNV